MATTSRPALQQRRQAVVTGNRVEVLVKSRDRVKAYGEVFTPADMVERMLDLVRPELETGPGFVDKTFFEPAAGDGNFLTAIFRRKLAAIEKRYKPSVWPAESLFALASIYAVELLEDNHADAQANMLGEFVAFHTKHDTSCGPRTNLFRAANHLIAANIVQGNTLTGLDAAGQPLTFFLVASRAQRARHGPARGLHLLLPSALRRRRAVVRLRRPAHLRRLPH